MIDLAPLLFSLAMVAAIALAIGGARLLTRPAERRRGVLMLVAALVVLGNVLIIAWPR